MSKYLFYFIFLLILLLSYGCGDSSGNEESQSLPHQVLILILTQPIHFQEI